MHEAAWNFVARAARDITARRLRVVEIGSRNLNGSVRPIFDGHDYTGVDVAPGDGVDVVADGATWGEDGAYDVGVCCEVLEHAHLAHHIVSNLRRIVRPGGLVIITCATHPREPHSGVDGRPLAPEEYHGELQLQIAIEEMMRERGLLREEEVMTSAGIRKRPTVRPEYYHNVAPDSLLHWLNGCPYINIEVERGDLRAIAQVG